MRTSTIVAVLAGGAAIYVLTRPGGLSLQAAAGAGPGAAKPKPQVAVQPESGVPWSNIVQGLGNLAGSIVQAWKPSSAPTQAAGNVTTGPDTSGTGSAPTPVPWYEGGQGMSDGYSDSVTDDWGLDFSGDGASANA